MKIFLFFSFFLSFFLNAHEITWDSPTTLSASMVDASEPQIVMDSSGNVTVAWVESTIVKACNLPYGGSWGSVETLSSSGSSSPKLAVDASGNVYAVWVDSGVVKTSTMSSGGSWGAVTSLSSSGASSPAVAVAPSGDIVVVWERNGYIEAKTKLILGLWGLVSVLSSSGSDHPDVAVGANGYAMVVWHTNGSNDIIYSSAQILGGVWGAVKSLMAVSPEFKHDYPKIDVDASGNAIAIWYRYKEINDVFIGVSVLSSTLPYGGASWSPIPSLLSRPGIATPGELNAKVKFDAAGNAIGMWTMSYDNSTFSIEGALKLIGQDWTSTQTLVEADSYAFGLDLATNELGESVISYSKFDGSSITVQTVESNISGTFQDIFWSIPIQLSGSDNAAYPKISSILLGSDVLAAAAWLDYNGSDVVLQVSTGSRGTVAPPSNLSVTQDSIDFGVYVDYTNTITWDPSPTMDVQEYEVFRNGVLFTRVNAAETLEVVEHNVNPSDPVTYGIACIDNLGTQSVTVTINTP